MPQSWAPHGHACDRHPARAGRPDKVDDPTDLDRHSWLYVLRRTGREFSADQCTDLAAALTYYAVLALFPAAIALTSVLGARGAGHRGRRQVLEILGPDRRLWSAWTVSDRR